MADLYLTIVNQKKICYDIGYEEKRLPQDWIPGSITIRYAS